MSVAIVTESIADLPAELVSRFGITVVPILVRFGEQTYRDGVDISVDRFYDMLRESARFPSTAAPSPAVYAEAYAQAAERSPEIAVLSASSSVSALSSMARQAVALAPEGCRIEVLDTRQAAMGLGLVVLAASEAAAQGAPLDAVIERAADTARRIELIATFNTLEYLKRGGRIGAAAALMGSMLKVNPLIALRNGEIIPAGRTRSRRLALNRLVDFVAGYETIEALAVENTACPEDAATIRNRLSDGYPGVPIYESRMTAAVGTHTGPGLVVVVVQGKRKQV